MEVFDEIVSSVAGAFILYAFYYLIWGASLEKSRIETNAFTAGVLSTIHTVLLSSDIYCGESCDRICQIAVATIDDLARRRKKENGLCLEYRDSRGFHYSAFISTHDAVLFAFIIMARVAIRNDQDDSAEKLDSMMLSASRASVFLNI